MRAIPKYLGAAVLSLLFLILSFFVPAVTNYAYAEEDAILFDETDVLEDLESTEGFSLWKYPHYESNEPEMRVVDFVEYCYDSRTNMRGNYGLYLYVYNPNGQNVVINSTKNKVQLAVAYDGELITRESNILAYEKFDLQFCSVSEGSGVEKLFYKFKVIDHKSADGKTIAERVDSMERRYDISGIELLTEGNLNATEYDVSTSYFFTGFAEGYGESGKGTMLARDTLETVKLDLYSTTYRFPYINQNGPGHQNQLDSVYFAVPKEFNENYGDLYRVKCCWNEQKTSPVIVTNRQEVYEDVAAHLGTDGSGAKYELYDNFRTSYMGEFGFNYADWAFNCLDDLFSDSASAKIDKTPVGYTFKTDKSNVKDTDLTSTQMKDWIYGHNNADYLFSDIVDEGRTKGYQEHTFTADEPFDMLTFNQTASGWDKFCLNWQAFWTGKSWDFGPEQQAPVEPIRLVKDSDFTGTDVTDAEKLYVHTEDFDEFESFYNANKSTKNVFLLRFAVTDYYSNLVRAGYHEFESFPSPGGYRFHGDEDSTYMARETVFLDFDIIELTFLRDTTETIIPVVASPIDVVGGISAPIEKDGFAWWKVILAVLALVLLIIVLQPVLPFVVQAVIWLVMAPFKLIAIIVRAIQEGIARSKRRKQERAEKKAQKERDRGENPAQNYQ